MTVISFNLSKTACEVIANGHAEYAEQGKDIVCAAVSALLMGLAAWLEQIAEDGREISIEEETLETGHVDIAVNGPRLEDAFLQTWAGLKLIERAYPDNVKVRLKRA